MKTLSLAELAQEADCFARKVFPMFENGFRVEYETIYNLGLGALRVLEMPEAVSWFETALRQKKLNKNSFNAILCTGAPAFFYMEKHQNDYPNYAPFVDRRHFMSLNNN